MKEDEKCKERNRNSKWQKRRHKKQKSNIHNVKEDAPVYDGWVKEKKNEEFEKYYKEQRILPEEEWDTFMHCLQTPLPSSFRIIDGTLHTHYILKYVESIEEKCKTKLCSSSIKDLNLCRIDWYPNNLAFEIKVTRATLRKYHDFKLFHEFLVRQSESGTIFRQETVSMIPVLLLNIKKDSYVLDMCSAPGSKTAQIIEEMHRQANAFKNGLKDLKGVVVANDLNCDRGHMLLHRLKHLNSPCVIVTAHAAQSFPSIFRKDTLNRIYFDAVLCDVPCSSDGTLRKAEIIWKTWCSSAGIGLHRLQLQILKRGIQLCKVGGRIVYSTCSLNPLENEAVVAATLEKFGSSLELLDMSNELTQLKRRPGMLTWKVLWKNEWYSSYEEFMIKRNVKKKHKIRKTMFAPKENSYVASQLHKCMRFFPHDLDAGGFFVAVFVRKGFCCFENMNEVKTDEISFKEESNKMIVRSADDDEIKIIGGTAVSDSESIDNERTLTLLGSDCEEDKEIEVKEESENTENIPDILRNQSKRESDHMNVLDKNFCNKTQTDFLCLMDLKNSSQVSSGSVIWKDLSSLYNIHYFNENEIKSEKSAFEPEIALNEQEKDKHNCESKQETKEHESCESDTSILNCLFVKLPILDCDKPKKLWLCTKGVHEFMTSVGLKPYKVLNMGCVAFELACKTKYRISYGGATLLMPYINFIKNQGMMKGLHLKSAIAENNEEIIDETSGLEKRFGDKSAAAELRLHGTSAQISLDETLEIPHIAKNLTKGYFPCTSHVHLVSSSTLLKLIALNESPPRVNIETLPLQAQEELSCLVSNSPNLLVTPVAFYRHVPVPCWKGVKNVELMIQNSLRYALKCLLDDTTSMQNV